MKIFITGASFINKLDLATELIHNIDDLNVSETFTTDKSYKDKETTDFIYYMSKEDVLLSFKNNFILYMTYNNDLITGMTVDNFYNGDIINLELDNFNNIPNHYFQEDDIIIWLDSKKHPHNIHKDLVETKYLVERLTELNLKYLYFLDEPIENIISVIKEYIYSDNKEAILEEWS